jgi:hypothetical protein
VRAYLRGSVRGLMLFVVSVAVVLGWTVHVAHEQRRAVAAIEASGGSVDYDWSWSEGDYLREQRPPSWLHERLGIDYFLSVSRVIVHDCESEALIAQIGNLSRLEALYLAGPAVTDDPLKHLGRLQRLQELRLSGTDVGDTGLSRLKSLKQLRRLFTAGTRISDAGLMHLTCLKNLELFHLRKTNVTREGALRLRQALPRLSINH